MADMDFPHKLTLHGRSTLNMTGVSEVLRFDENQVLLRIGTGTLVIQGDALQLKTLSLEGGQVEIRGRVCALIYEDPKPISNLFRRRSQ